MKILSHLPTSAENLDAILKFVILDSDAELIATGINELQRYSGGHSEEQILSALRESLLHGSPFVALEIATEIKKIMSAQNAGFFRQIADELEADSRIKSALEKALTTFR